MFVFSRRFWIWALAIGAWIPVGSMAWACPEKTLGGSSCIGADNQGTEERFAEAATVSPCCANPQNNLEPKAVDLLKAMSERLASAKTLQFTAITTYENPSRLGPALAYHTRSEVILQRPNKLQVLSPGDGPASEFYYNGKTLVAFAPQENLAAVVEAPGSIDEALKFAYDTAAIYFPFTDFLVANPYGDIAGDLKTAFYIGQSQVIDGVTTDMIAIATDKVFAQIWIGAQDKLPRMIRAVYRDDPSRLRHQVVFANWRLDQDIPPDAFGSTRANAAKPIPFKRPEPEPLEKKPVSTEGKP